VGENSARARRATDGHETTAIATVMLRMVGEKMATSTTASTKDGMVRKNSVVRMMRSSMRPP
jgi:hypothetical protein